MSCGAEGRGLAYCSQGQTHLRSTLNTAQSSIFRVTISITRNGKPRMIGILMPLLSKRQAESDLILTDLRYWDIGTLEHLTLEHWDIAAQAQRSASR